MSAHHLNSHMGRNRQTVGERKPISYLGIPLGFKACLRTGIPNVVRFSKEMKFVPKLYINYTKEISYEGIPCLPCLSLKCMINITAHS